MTSPIWFAAVGDATHPGTFSGIPYHCLQAATAGGLAAQGMRFEAAGAAVRRRRWLWNAWQLASTRRWGGYQFSNGFLERLWATAEAPAPGSGVVNFFQLYPRSVAERTDIRRWFYIDQTLRQLFDYYGHAAAMSPPVVADALARERRQYHACEAVLCHTAWAAASVIDEYGVPPERVRVVGCGANLDAGALSAWERVASPREPSDEIRLVFVGKDWRRKGLDRLIRAMRIARSAGASMTLHVLGVEREGMPEELASVEGVVWHGMVDKRRAPEAFIRLVSDCHVGCLLSRAEAGGISLLEFARLGLPTLAPATGGSPEFTMEGATTLVDVEESDDALGERLIGIARDRKRLRQQADTAWTRRGEADWSNVIARMRYEFAAACATSSGVT